jgi:glyoxylase-like metal-dependent hydrolase (beta-lactamase superfamily II)
VRLITPVYGCVIRGCEAVAVHLKLAVKALRIAGSLPDLAWTGPASKRRPITHEPCLAYVILGATKTLMVDTGHFAHWYSLEGQLAAVLQGRTLDYVFPTHQEIPHSGSLSRLLHKYPQAVAVGDREFVVLDAIWKDLSGTMLREMSAGQAKQATDRPTLPFTGMELRDQSARVAAFLQASPR